MNAGKFVKKLRLESDSIIVLKRASPFASMNRIEELIEAIKGAGLVNVLIVVVDDLDDFSTLSEIEMNKRGWERIGSKNTRYPVVIRETTEISSEVSQQ